MLKHWIPGFTMGLGSSLSALYCRRHAQCTTANSKSNSRNFTLLQDKVVLITGATAGIGIYQSSLSFPFILWFVFNYVGKATAWRFAENGSKLILIGRRGDKLDELKAQILKTYPNLKIHSIAMSVTDYDKVASLPHVLSDEFKNVDVLVNNAGLALGRNPRRMQCLHLKSNI